jgi:hypothetical protein
MQKNIIFFPSTRIHPRVTCLSFHFKGDEDFDGNGIIYYVTFRGSHGMTVTSSSVEVGSPGELLGKLPCELWTKDIPGKDGKKKKIFPIFLNFFINAKKKFFIFL